MFLLPFLSCRLVPNTSIVKEMHDTVNLQLFDWKDQKENPRKAKNQGNHKDRGIQDNDFKVAYEILGLHPDL